MIKHAQSGTVLVTGGTGLVGSHLVERLLRNDYSVTCLVRDPNRLRWLSGLKVRLVKGDCSEPSTLRDAVRGVSAVYHVAGLTKAKRARDYFEVNHIGTRNILEACARHNPGLGKFILVSSLAAAGPSPDGSPLKDIDPPRPVSDYGRSKLLAEQETLRYRDRFRVVILRPSAVYGPRDTDVYELFRWASRGLVLEIGGSGRFINPCYVEDLAEALLLAMKKDVPSGSVYFVAEDRAYSLSAFMDLLLASGEVRARRIRVPYGIAYLVGLASEAAGFFQGKAALTNRQKIREAAQKYWLCDVSKIRRDFGFTAHYPLKQGLEVTWKWYRENRWLS
jgi:nucleoside-diphosphate-sugar epimerase